MPEPRTHEVTGLLQAWSSGDASALEKLTPLVYAELRRLARRYMGGESSSPLQATELVHEAYLRLVNVRQVNWQNRAHFFAVSARTMRRILVEFARSRNSLKRRANSDPLSLDEAVVIAPESAPDIVRLDLALESLATLDPRKSQVVELRFFGGLNAKETAEVLHVSEETVARDWKLAKVWLLREMQNSPARNASTESAD